MPHTSQQVEDTPDLALLPLEDSIRGTVTRAWALRERARHGGALAVADPGLREEPEDQAAHGAKARQRPHEAGRYVGSRPLRDRVLRGLETKATVRVPQHGLGNPVTLGLVRVEQLGIRLSFRHKRQLPPQVVGVTDA